MNTIYKYPVSLDTIAGMFTVMMPEGALVLSVQTQFGHPQMWARVDTSKRITPRAFALLATGQEIPPDLAARLGAFLGTVQVERGEFVFHLFEVLA
jgi:hypothetical protein